MNVNYSKILKSEGMPPEPHCEHTSSGGRMYSTDCNEVLESGIELGDVKYELNSIQKLLLCIKTEELSMHRLQFLLDVFFSETGVSAQMSANLLGLSYEIVRQWRLDKK